MGASHQLVGSGSRDKEPGVCIFLRFEESSGVARSSVRTCWGWFRGQPLVFLRSPEPKGFKKSRQVALGVLGGNKLKESRERWTRLRGGGGWGRFGQGVQRMSSNGSVLFVGTPQNGSCPWVAL